MKPMRTKIIFYTGSICSINGYILVYTKSEDLTFRNSDDAIKV
jgi:hypothetical protein